MVACCGTESVIREVTWGGSLHKEHVVRDVRLDATKQVSPRLFPGMPWCFRLVIALGCDCQSLTLIDVMSLFVAA